MPSTPSPVGDRPGGPGMKAEIEAFDPAAAPDGEVTAAARLRRKRWIEFRPGDPVYSVEEVEAALRAPVGEGRDRGMISAASRHGHVGFATWWWESDNPNIAWLDAYVSPVWRRKGVGKRLVATSLEDVKRRHEIDTVGFALAGHVAVGRELQEVVENEWGLPVRNVERISRLDLGQLDRDAVRAQLAQRMAQTEDAYALHFFQMDELPGSETGFDLPDYLDMVEEIENLMPLEDLELEPERYTEQRFRDQVAHQRAQGRVIWNYVALERETGKAVGITNVSFKPEDPRLVNQWDTGVRKSHWGRGLGWALKLAMIDRLLREVPRAMFIDTGNAKSNEPMLAINDKLGFAELFRWHAYQVPEQEFRRLAGL